MDKIIPVVLWIYAKHLVLNRLLIYNHISIWENTKLGKKTPWFKTSPMGCKSFLLRCIPGHKAILPRSPMVPGLSYKSPVASFAKYRAAKHSCAVISYPWGGMPGIQCSVLNYCSIAKAYVVGGGMLVSLWASGNSECSDVSVSLHVDGNENEVCKIQKCSFALNLNQTKKVFRRISKQWSAGFYEAKLKHSKMSQERKMKRRIGVCFTSFLGLHETNLKHHCQIFWLGRWRDLIR